MKRLWLPLFFLLGFPLAGFSFINPPKPPTGHLFLHFRNQVDGRPLVLGDSLHKYSNANGDRFYVTTFKYYISNIQLITAKGETVTIPDTYLLVNAADSSTLVQDLGVVPVGKYKSIRFIIGVDSLRNFSGAQSGSLDPAKGMFWTWKSGYIFVKMEGISEQSTDKKNRLVFHIGGAISPDNTIRNYSQVLPRTLKMKEGRDRDLVVVVNLASMFKGKTTVDFSNLHFTMGGPKSVIIADNYAEGLFTITRK